MRVQACMVDERTLQVKPTYTKHVGKTCWARTGFRAGTSRGVPGCSSLLLRLLL